MRQGNGSDLLGANDPRSATIGVIYVAPNDDRESVLAAILTQEKLGRKQIAIVLPAQNKAFQRFIDFEGLKNMRRKLQAQLIIVAPQGSSPAEFARQRRFTFFSSLESYGRSLRDESDASRSVKRGWFGGRGSTKSGNGAMANGDEGRNMAAPGDPQPLEFPTNNDAHIYADERDNNARPNPIIPFATGAGAGFIADAELHHPEEEDTLESPQMSNSSHFDNDELDLPPASPAFGNTPDDDEEIQVLPPPPIDYGDDQSESADNVDDDMVGADDDESLPPNAPIPFIVPTPIPVPDEEPASTGVVSPIPMRRTTGKQPVAAGVQYQAGGVNATRYSAANSAVSPTRNTSGRRRSGWQLLLLALIGLLLLSLLLCGGIALAAPGTLGSALGSLQHFGSNVVGGGGPAATVSITPKNTQLSNTYVVTSIFGTPDPSKRQIEARQLTFTTQPQSKTVPATGVVKTQGSRATGTLTFFNGTLSAYYVAANTQIPDAQGIVIVNDTVVAIPPGNPNSGYGHATVSAHALNVGANGNIPPGEFSNYVCCGSSVVGISTNSAFTGGQDPQNFTAVQQSDVDGAANPLKPALLQAALSTLNGLKRSGEQYVNKPSCTTKVTANPPVGTKATSVTASVTATCSAEAYDQAGAETIAANLLNAEANKDTGGGYTLSGNITPTITSVSAGSQGNLTLLVKASGTWVYQFTPAVKTSLAKLIAGKTKEQATALLLQQPGIGSVTITIANGDTLPTDYTQINIAVPSAGQGTPTVGTGSPTPTVTPTHIPPPGTTTPIGGS